MRQSLASRLALTLAPLALAACASNYSYRLSTSVHGLQPGGRDASGLTEVSGAQIALECPDAAQNRALGVTDANGQLQAEGEGSIGLACKVSVTQPGYKSMKYSVSQICEQQSGDSCRAADLRVVLQPQQVGSAGGTN